MTYSAFGIIAIIILIIVNQDVIWKHDGDLVPAHEAYREYLLSLLLYYVTDVLWGYLDHFHLAVPLFADTTVYFIAMGAAILLWTRFVVTYLEEKNTFGQFLIYSGWAFFIAEIVFVSANLFTPILFWVDESARYHAALARYITLGVQIAMFLLTFAYTFFFAKRTTAPMTRRYHTIGIVGLALAILVGMQVFDPLVPLYTVANMIGTCLLHSYVLEDEKEEYRRQLEDTIEQISQKELQLRSARQLAYTDPLTGVKSKHAHIEAEELMDQRIAQGSVEAFGVVVFDLNGLKHVNDTQGHEVGDRYIINACKLICHQFSHSPVFRIGGDEFLAQIEGEDYGNRFELLLGFNQLIEQNLQHDLVVIAAGMAEYDPALDKCYQSVFDRADAQMYVRKRYLQSLGAVFRD